MGEYDSELKILMELIKANDKSSNDKFETISCRLLEHSKENKEEFRELKNILKDYNKEMVLTNKELIEEVIKPMKTMIHDHDFSIKEMKKERSNFVKKEICKINENEIEKRFNTLTKKIIIYNAIFAIIYIVVLINSNLTFNWESIFKVIGLIKGIF
jgi:hypothetical protein